MPFPQEETHVPGIRHLTRTLGNGPRQGSRNRAVARTHSRQGSTILPWVLQFLPQIYQGLLEGSTTAIRVNAKGTPLELDLGL